MSPALGLGWGSVDTWILGTTVLATGVTMAKAPAPSPPAFRAEAVALARPSGQGIPALARDLGVAEQARRGWLQRSARDAGRGEPGARTTAEREERRRLRRAVQPWPHERAILRKAAASSAKETR